MCSLPIPIPHEPPLMLFQKVLISVYWGVRKVWGLQHRMDLLVTGVKSRLCVREWAFQMAWFTKFSWEVSGHRSHFQNLFAWFLESLRDSSYGDLSSFFRISMWRNFWFFCAAGFFLKPKLAWPSLCILLPAGPLPIISITFRLCHTSGWCWEI